MTIEHFLQVDSITLPTIVLRLGISFVLSAIIGIEREKNRQPAGLRTHILICLGATIIMIISLYIPQWSDGRFQSDPGRIAAQIVTGIGFLGAGAILKIGLNVKGLTTAANVWVVAAIGMTVGAGLYVAAAIVTGFTLLVLIVLNKIENKFLKNQLFKVLTIHFKANASRLNKVLEIMENEDITVTNIDVYESEKKKMTIIRLIVKVPGKWDISGMYESIRALDGVVKINLHESYGEMQ
jgi:putative Mg2+ transporter-C (MgtC) family protein